jgi:hypothetical protein
MILIYIKLLMESSVKYSCECCPGFFFKTESTYMKHFSSKKHKEFDRNDQNTRLLNLVNKFCKN